MALARWSAVGDCEEKLYRTRQEKLHCEATQISDLQCLHSGLFKSGSSVGSSSRDASPHSSKSSISSISEAKWVHPLTTTTSSKRYNYDLPCEFAFAGCEVRFEPQDVYCWIEHSISHFAGQTPPPFAICTFCDETFGNEDNDVLSWRERMMHIKEHIARDEACQMKPDYWVVEYLMKNELLTETDYTNALKYVKKPFPANLLQTKGEVEALKKHRKEQFSQFEQKSPVRSEQKEELRKQKNVQNLKVCELSRHAAGARNSDTKSRKRRHVAIVLHQKDETVEQFCGRIQPQSVIDKPEPEIVLSKIAYLDQVKVPTSDFSLSSPTSEINETLCSEDATDWEDGETEEVDKEVGKESTRSARKDHSDQMTAALISRVKATLPNVLPDKLWDNLLVAFTHESNALITQTFRQSASHSSSSSSSTSTEGLVAQNGSEPGHKGLPKRIRGNQDDEFEDDGHGSPSPNLKSSDPGRLGQTQEFACPFRKYNSRKYSLRKWRDCTLKSHLTVARLKAHLYKYHLIHQCPRCQDLFDSDEKINTHLKMAQVCDLKPEIEVEGITKSMHDQIKSRKKAFKGQTEVNRWEQIYKILFPGAAVPNPYFEPINDQEPMEYDVSDKVDIADFRTFFLRAFIQELPGLMQSYVDLDASSTDTQHRDRATNLFGEKFDKIFMEYQSSKQTPVNAPSPTFADMQITSATSSDSGYISQSHNAQYSNNTNLPYSAIQDNQIGALQPEPLLSSDTTAIGSPLSYSSLAIPTDAFWSDFEINAYQTSFQNKDDIYSE